MIRRLLSLLLLASLGVACGAGGEHQQAGEGEPAGGEVAGDAEGAGFPRTVEHAMGNTEIPARPQRVVVLDTGELDSAVALGVTPIGAVRAPVEDGFLEYLSAETGETELVGAIDAVNLEAVAALRPDLILSSALRHEDLYDELSAIAPTVFTEAVGVVWKENLAVHAEALGREEEADALLAAYDERTADLAGRLQEERGELPTVSVVRFLPGSTRLYQKASFIGTVLEDVGLPRPPAQDVDDFALEISAEQIAEADADVIFTTHYGPADDTTQRSLTENPIWHTLGAVQTGDVHPVADDHWMLGIGIGAANLVLDDLERLLLES